MRPGRQRRLAHPAEEGAEGGIAAEVGAQGEGVDEEADHPLDPGLGAVGDGSAHHQVGLAGEAAQESREGGEAGHEQRGALATRKGAESRRDPARKGERQGGAAEALEGRARPVGRQLQEGRRAGEPLPPIGELRFERRAGEPTPLPDGEVAILERRLRERRGVSRHERRVEGGKLAPQHLDRPAVEGDVVDEEAEMVPPRVEAQQRGARHGAAGEVERAPRLPRRQTRRLGVGRNHRQLREVDARQPRRLERRHDLPRLASPGLGEGGAQRLVAPEHVVEGALQGRRVERAGEAEHHRQVVKGRAGLQAVEEPEALLGEGERQGLGASVVRGADERRPRGIRFEFLADPRRQRRQGAGLEGRAHRQLDAEGGTHPGEHLPDEEGVPAEVDEVVAGAVPGAPQHFPPDPRQQLLGGGPRRDESLGGRRLIRLRRWQRAAVDLAAGRERHRRQNPESGGDHVGRQAGAEEGAKLVEVRTGIRHHEIGGEAEVAGGRRVGDDRHLADPGVLGDLRLDLARLDAEATHLDLLVGAAEELELAVGTETDEVAGAVEARPASVRIGREAVGNEGGGGQVRPPQVAPGQTTPAEMELARDPRWEELAVAAEHQQAVVGDRPPDRRLAVLPEPGHRGADARLGRPVGVPQPASRSPARHQLRRRSLAAHHQADQAGKLAARPLRHRRQRRGREEHVGDPALAEGGEQRRAGEDLLATAEDQRGAADQRAPGLPHRGVEARRGGLQDAGLRPQPRPRRQPLDGPQEAAVGDQHSLRAPGRPRGVDDVGEVAGLDLRQQLRARRRLDGSVEEHDLGATRRQRRGEGAAGEEQRSFGVRQDQRQPLGRKRRIERQEGAAGGEHGEEADQRLRHPLGIDADQDVASHAAGPQVAGEPPGALGELAVGERLRGGVGRQHGDRFRVRARQGGDPRRHRAVPRRLLSGPSPVGEQGLPLGVAQQRKVRDARFRGRHGAGQQGLPAAGEPLDRRRREEVGAGDEAPADLLSPVLEVEQEIELRRAGLLLPPAHRQTRRQLPPAGVAVEGEEGLKQRLRGGRPGPQQLGQSLERQVLMGIEAERPGAHEGEQLAEGGISGMLDPQGEGAGEEADQSLQLRTAAMGQHRADDDVVLAADAAQERRPGGEQGHVRRGAAPARQRADAAGEAPAATPGRGSPRARTAPAAAGGRPAERAAPKLPPDARGSR